LSPTSIANPTGAVAHRPEITTNYAQVITLQQRELPGSMAVTVSFVGAAT
jgi:hypothetical protein